MTAKPPLDLRIAAIEVVREGRFKWQVHSRYPGGIDMCVNTPFWFRWRAERYARRQAEMARREGMAPQVVSRIELGVERELLDGPS